MIAEIQIDDSPKAQARRLAPHLRYDAFYVLATAIDSPDGLAVATPECAKELLAAKAVTAAPRHQGAKNQPQQWCAITAFGRVLHKACVERRQRIAMWMQLSVAERQILVAARGTGFVDLPDGSTCADRDRCIALDYIERCSVHVNDEPTWGWGLTAEGKLIVEAAA